MISKLSFSLFVLSLLFITSSSSPPIQDEKLPAFTYTGHKNGPREWGHLCSAYTKCGAGVRQSPVNIEKDKVVLAKKWKPLARYYKPANATLVDNGFNVGVYYEEDPGVLEIYGKKYTLKQMHWHSPSEHRIEGVQYPAELHLVHEAEDKNLSVVAILFKYGKPDPLISKIKKKVDELAKDVYEGHEHVHIPLGKLDLKQLRKGTRKYYRYVGSLTTPPCSETLIWNILGKVRSISKEQVNCIKKPLHSPYKNNSRPVQPLHGRKIELFDELAQTDKDD